MCEVHIWRAHLDCSDNELGKFTNLVSADEHARANRFHFMCDRRRFLAARGILREILAHYTGTPANGIVFRYGKFGKPALADPSSVSFNLSHSADIALCAITSSCPVGVDIERVRPGIDLAGIATRFFSPAENAALWTLPTGHQCQAFFDCWTRKESYIKALGDGLSIPLDRFDVSHAPGVPARLIADRADPSASERWTIRQLKVGKGYAAAVAVEAEAADCVVLDWPGLKADEALFSSPPAQSI
jgi:4'-phosphopantetheinyl transferase